MSADELPDPMELFQKMRRLAEGGEAETADSKAEELPDPAELFREMEAYRQQSLGEDEDLPDPMELFQQMQRASDATQTSETDDSLPDPELLLEQMRRYAIPDLEPPLPPMPESEQSSAEPSEESGGFLQRMRKKLRGEKSAEPTENIPSPEELFQQYEMERVEDALTGLGDEPGEAIPSPEEMFRRMAEEENDGTLPALPDLDALKAELEAEERARLDPDVETDLSGPERFVETVSDSIFGSTVLPGFSEPPPAPPAPPPAPKQPEPVKPEPVEPKQTPLSIQEKQIDDRKERLGPTGTVRVDLSDNYEPPDEGTRRRAWDPEPQTVPEYRPTKRPASAEPKLKPKAKPTSESAVKKPKKKKVVPKRFNRYKLAIFTRQMAVMLKSGIQLHMAIQFAAESDPEMKTLLEGIMHKVESGYTFSSAIKESSRSFDPVYVGLVQTGEMSGRLPGVLGRLADILEKEVELRKRLISVITYPVVLLSVCLLGTLGFMFFVLPTLEPLFLDLDVPLPLPTLILLSARDFILPVIMLLVLTSILLFMSRDRITDYVRSKPSLERRLASIPLTMPIAGPVYEKAVTSRVLYSMSTMLDVGITMNQALTRAELTSGNALISFKLGRARTDLADGLSVTDCFKDNELFNASALHLINAGEEAAKLAEMFAFVAKLFDEDVEYSIQSASSVAEPLIMVVMGLIVGFITIAAALPTIQLLQKF